MLLFGDADNLTGHGVPFDHTPLNRDIRASCRLDRVKCLLHPLTDVGDFRRKTHKLANSWPRYDAKHN